MPTEYDHLAETYDCEYGLFTDDVDFYVSEAKAAQPPVLELACGTGRVTLLIAQAGVPVVGVDSSEQMLAGAGAKSADMGDLPLRWELADMRHFQLEERFGLVIIPARSFLHLLDSQDHVQALNNIHRHLQPGGRLILNFFVPHLQLIAAHSGHLSQAVKFMREFTIPDSGEHYLVWESRQYDVHQQRITERLRYEQLDERGNIVATHYRDLTLCYIWPREMEHLLVRCGFEIEALYGGFDRQPFDAKSPEQIWVARRP